MKTSQLEVMQYNHNIMATKAILGLTIIVSSTSKKNLLGHGIDGLYTTDDFGTLVKVTPEQILINLS